jgi:exonuclease SbcD
MKILHTSDWHLGRQFHNYSLLEDQRHVLQQICEIVAEQQVDVVIVAGDIYDRSVPPAAAVELLDETIDRICHDLQVPMIIIAGNHDSPERLGFGARQLATAGLHVVGNLWQIPQPIVLTDRSGETAAFYPIPYADPVTVRHYHNVEVTNHEEAMSHLIDLIHKSRDPEIPAVAIAHCFLAGGEGSESERPLSIGGVEYVSSQLFSDFAYTALGHLHGPQLCGAETIRYSGSPLKYSFSEETQNKSVTLVDLSLKKKISIKKIPIIPIKNMRTLHGLLEDILTAGNTDSQYDDYLRIQLTDTHAILDVMNKLRDVYPNILHLERPGLAMKQSLQADRERLQRGELAMFRDFYQQVTGEKLSTEQDQIVSSELEQLQRGDN